MTASESFRKFFILLSIILHLGFYGCDEPVKQYDNSRLTEICTSLNAEQCYVKRLYKRENPTLLYVLKDGAPMQHDPPLFVASKAAILIYTALKKNDEPYQSMQIEIDDGFAKFHDYFVYEKSELRILDNDIYPQVESFFQHSQKSNVDSLAMIFDLNYFDLSSIEKYVQMWEDMQAKCTRNDDFVLRGFNFDDNTTTNTRCVYLTIKKSFSDCEILYSLVFSLENHKIVDMSTGTTIFGTDG